MTELCPENFVNGDIVQCRDLISQDPQNREYWYDTQVVEIKRNNLGRTTEYVVKPVNGEKSRCRTVSHSQHVMGKAPAPSRVRWTSRSNKVPTRMCGGGGSYKGRRRKTTEVSRGLYPIREIHLRYDSSSL